MCLTTKVFQRYSTAQSNAARYPIDPATRSSASKRPGIYFDRNCFVCNQQPSRRVIEQQQHQRQRVMMVFGKPDLPEGADKSAVSTSRSILLPITENRMDDVSSAHDVSLSTVSRLVPLQPDNIPMNLLSRYETATSNQLASLNRIQNIVRKPSVLEDHHSPSIPRKHRR